MAPVSVKSNGGRWGNHAEKRDAAFSTFQESRMEVSQTEGQNLRWQEGSRRAAKLKIITCQKWRGNDFMATGMCVKTHGAGDVCVRCDQFMFCPTLSHLPSVSTRCCIYIFVHDILKLYVSGSSADLFPKASCLIAEALRELFQSPKHTSVNKINRNHL